MTDAAAVVTTELAPAPVSVPAPATAASAAPVAAVAPAAPASRPHPAEYYSVPSSTAHSTAPVYTAADLVALAALPADSAGYAPLKKHHLINPHGAPAVAVTAAPTAQESDSRKARKLDHDAAAPTSSSCRHDGDDTNACAPDTAAAAATPAAAAAKDGDAAMAESNRNKRKRERGQNKNSERDIFKPRAKETRLCRATMAGIPCTRPNCNFSHDAAASAAAVVQEAPYQGPCEIWAKYGMCPSGAACKWASEGHLEALRPAVLPAEPYTTPISHELNIPSREMLAEARGAGVGGRRHDKLFPRTVELMKKYESWKKSYDQLRDKKQREKQAAQKEVTRLMKAAREAALVAKAAAAAAPVPTPTPVVDAAASTAAVVPAASTEAVAMTDVAAPAAVATEPATAAVAAPSVPAVAVVAAPAAGGVIISPQTLPPTFIPNTAEVELEIAAAKALYTPAFPMKLDPFQIVTEAYTDWSSGVILIDLERKKFDFRDKLYLAPLTTVGNLPFRLVCREFGCDVTIGEMAMCSSLGKGSNSEWALLRRHAKEKYFGVQLACAFPDQMARACELINEHCKADFVDLNIGCPIDQVTDKGMGSAMMQRKRSKGLEPMLRTMTAMLDCPATLKMRMGWSTTELTAMDLLPIAARSGMAAVTIHGRTRQQRYTKSANWQFIQEAATFAKEKLNNLPIIANGDVYSFEDYEAIVNPESNVTTTMIARGALVKPWIFTEIKERRHWDISASERLDMLRSFVSAGHEHFGTDTKGVESTRRYLLEWLSFLHRYVPVGLLEVPRVGIQLKSPPFYARSDLEQLFASPESKDWIRISEMLIGPVPEGFKFTPKHKSSSSEEGGRQTQEG